MKKRLSLLSLLLAFVVTVMAQTSATLDGVSYNVDTPNKTAEVVAGGYMGDVAIPATISVGGTECAVTSIGNYAFGDCEDLTSVTLPASLTTIGTQAFYYCKGLTSIEIPASVTNIEGEAFYNCSNLTTVTMQSATPPTLGADVFTNCYTLSTFNVPPGATEAYNVAPWNTYNVVEAEIPNPVEIDGIYYNLDIENKTAEVAKHTDYAYGYSGDMTIPTSVSAYGIEFAVTSIGDGAFSDNRGIESLTLPNTVTSIAAQAFRDASFTSIILSNSLKTIASYTFYQCENLRNVVFPSELTTIEEGAFNGCSDLENLELPSKLTTIGNSAFGYCRSLNSVVIPTSVTSIGEGVFGSASLEEIEVAAGNSVYDSRENCNAIIETSSNTLIQGSENTVIPSSVTSLGKYAFEGVESWKYMVIPSTVTYVGTCAFMECSMDGLTMMAATPPSVGNSLFSWAWLNTIYVPAGSAEAYNVEPWNEFNIVEMSNLVEIDGIYYSLDIENKTAEVNDGRACSGELVLPASVSAYGIEFAVTSIGTSAFWESSLTSVTLPNSLKVIGPSGFNKCRNLVSVTIPNSVETIHGFAFDDCYALTEIEIPASVTYLADYVFNECSGLRRIVVAPENTIYDSRDNCNAIIRTADNTLMQGCSETVIPETVTAIYPFAFQGCTNLENIEIPSSVTSIGTAAFDGCTSLANIVIPSSVTSLTSFFHGCTALESLTMQANTPPAVSVDNLFDRCTNFSTIYVPAGAAAAYNVEPWNTYNVVEMGNLVEAGGIYYKVDVANKTAEVTNSIKYSGDIVIPESISAYGIECMVTSLGDNAFLECYDLKSISLPNTLTKIGGWAFKRCSALTELEIPASVTSIGIYALESLKVQNIEIPNSVTELAEGVFYDCSSLTSVKLSNALTNINNRAFENCTSLQSIEIPALVTSIGSDAFLYCNSLESISVAAGNAVYDSREDCNAIIQTSDNTLLVGCKNTVIPNTITTIGRGAFKHCIGLTTVDMPNSVTFIGNGAFEGCTALESVKLSNTLHTIDYIAFKGCSALKEIELPSTLTFLGNWAFERSALQSIEIPSSVKLLRDGVFFDCSSLTSVELPNTLTTISTRVFDSCISLQSIEIPASVTSIGVDVFYNCNSLESISVAAGNAVYDSREGCNAIIQTSDNTMLVGCKNTVIPNTVTSIGGSAFRGCTGLTAVDIPNSVTYIGKNAFEGCSALESVNLSNTLETIDQWAFKQCPLLTKITLPNSLEVINEWAFESTALKNIVIPSSVNTIAPSAFLWVHPLESMTMLAATPPSTNSGNPIEQCGNMKTIYVPVGAAEAYNVAPWNTYNVVEMDDMVEIDGIYYNLDIENKTAHVNNGRACSGDLVLPASISAYGMDFSVVIILTTAFENSSLTSITLPNTLTGIAQAAFSGCSKLSSVTLSNSVTNIHGYAFLNCSALTEIEIPASVTYIADYVFNRCSGLKRIVVAPENTIYDSRDNCNAIIRTADNTLMQGCSETVIPETVTAIYHVAFQGCTSLESIEIPASVTSIGDDAFHDCTSLGSISVAAGNAVFDSREGCNAIIKTSDNTLLFGCKNTVIPNTVTSIGNSAFKGCIGLTAVDMPNSVTYIGTYAFDNCTALESVKLSNALETIDQAAFRRCSLLKNVIIPNSVEVINELAFESTALKTIVIPSSVNTIGPSTFLWVHPLESMFMQAATPPSTKSGSHIVQCENMKTIYVPVGAAEAYNISPWNQFDIVEMANPVLVDGVYYEVDVINKTAEVAGGPEKYSGSIVISDCISAYGLDLPVVSIGETAFHGCGNLRTITMKSETSPEASEATFEQCDRLTTIYIPLNAFAAYNVAPWNRYKMVEMGESLVLNDGEVYDREVGLQASDRVVYNRNFPHLKWQAWYVPFDMDYNDVSAEYTMASINDIREYDDNEDGVLDRWTLEVLLLREGETVYANMPYVIRPKQAGAKEFVVENATVYSAAEETVDCSSTKMLYTFKGVYSAHSADELLANGWLAMGDGGLVNPTVGSTLNPFRWYMAATPRGNYSTVAYAPKRVELVVVDENGEVTDIQEMPLGNDESQVWPADVYDLNGRLVKAQAESLDGLKKGIYVVNGQKFVK